MSEGKESKQTAVDETEPEDVINVTRIRFAKGSNNCALQAPLSFDVNFVCNHELVDARWEIKYLVDSITRRNLIALGQTPETTYDAGPCDFKFSVPTVDVSSVKASRLSNCGLLICTLVSASQGELADLKMVVQVREDGNDGHMRSIYSPLD